MEIAIDPRYLTIIPILVGLLSALKTAGFNPRYIPTLAIFAGILIGLMITNFSLYEGFVIGGGIGLSAIGVHSGVKNTIKK